MSIAAHVPPEPVGKSRLPLRTETTLGGVGSEAANQPVRSVAVPDSIDLARDLGFPSPRVRPDAVESLTQLRRYINLKLAASGLPTVDLADGGDLAALPWGLLEQHREKTRLLRDHRCPADQRIEAFLASHLADVVPADDPLRLPGMTFVLDRHGIARELALPHCADESGQRSVRTELLASYAVSNGVLHNPRADRRTTAGTFHVVEGGLPVPGDKKEVPRAAFAELFRHAMRPPAEMLRLPFTANDPQPAETFVSLLLRPMVSPAVGDVSPRRTMEVRFFAPGSLVANLDFVESIFGNGGDPFIPENDAGLDVGADGGTVWSGHTGCVILAPQLLSLTKRELGLPHLSDATERQRADGMCWESEDEIYNDGSAFKVTCRTSEGVVVTLIADNYFGYCKKEVKTQLSYAANLMGNAEEEHAGGAIAFASYSLGDVFQADSSRHAGRTMADTIAHCGGLIDVQPQGHAIDRMFDSVVYIPEDARADVAEQTVTWAKDGQTQSIPLDPNAIYIAPSGYKVHLEKHPAAPSWRLIGTVPEGTFCHKPCTVSGGGKSEISKSIVDFMHYGPIFVADIERDFDLIDAILARESFADRWRPDAADRQNYGEYESRSVLSERRSLGSVIKLLTPSEEYSEEYNEWLRSIPNHVFAILFIIKRFYRPEWDGDWRGHFGVDIVNGDFGHQLTLDGRELVGTYLRVGFRQDGSRRTFKLRQDFAAAAKVQTEDDITASTVQPRDAVRTLLRADGAGESPGVKFAENCEFRLFQRPDEAIHRGFDKQAEADLAQAGAFLSNFEPLESEEATAITLRAVDFSRYTDPMRDRLLTASESGSRVVASDRPRIVDGKPTKNPRYLQDRPDLMRPRDWYVAQMGARLARGLKGDDPVVFPVDAQLSGRRNNPPDYDAGIRPLAVFNPIHYQRLPELFMDYVCSLTGKSPSTTGAGSEGALTKGPFNMLQPAADLNAALLSMILTGLDGWSTAAGHVGPNVRVDHDVSLLVPEIWCRLSERERSAEAMIDQGMLEPLEDFERDGKTIPASRLGFRITSKFVSTYFGRVFDNPDKVFDEEILRPETQDAHAFADGILNIVEAQQRVARRYFEDGTIEECCPPLRAVIEIMASGRWEGRDASDPEFRRLFDRDVVLGSDWYRERLEAKQRRDVAYWQERIAYLRTFATDDRHTEVSERMAIADRLAHCEGQLSRVSAGEYVDSLQGTTGVQPSLAR